MPFNQPNMKVTEVTVNAPSVCWAEISGTQKVYFIKPFVTISLTLNTVCYANFHLCSCSPSF